VAQNVFFTGSGGTGKTLVLKRILRFLSGKYPGGNEVVVTAPTGIAGEG
jgi:Cdc6-like AAA superfamily ATPase